MNFLNKTSFAIVIILTSCSNFFGQGNLYDKHAWKIDSFISKAKRDFPEIQGLAISVVNVKEAIFMKGYGWANQEQGIKVDENTLFYIASCTKPFTALAAAILDKEKVISLDKPFKEYIPKISFENKFSDSISIRQLLTHTSGLTNYPITQRLSYLGNLLKKDYNKVLSKGTTMTGPHGKYDYDNFGYNLFTIILDEKMKLDWKSILEKRIFKPLGMNHTTVNTPSSKTRNIAIPYTAFGKIGMERLRINKTDKTMHSAGGIFSSVSDLSRFIQMELAMGRLNGKQVISSDIVKQTQQAYVESKKSDFPFQGKGEYGLGWNLNSYADQKVLYHYGGFPGFKSHISFMPDKKIGLAILVNEGRASSAFSDLLSAYVYDCLLGTDKMDEKYASFLKMFTKKKEEEKASIIKKTKELEERVWKLSLPLNSYTAKYENELLGQIEVHIVDNKLAVKMGLLYSIAQPYTQENTIRLELIPGQGEVVYFDLDEHKKKVNSLKYNGYIFNRTLGN